MHTKQYGNPKTKTKTALLDFNNNSPRQTGPDQSISKYWIANCQGQHQFISILPLPSSHSHHFWLAQIRSDQIKSDQMADGNVSRYVKLSKDQAPVEDITPGELNQPIQVPQVSIFFFFFLIFNSDSRYCYILILIFNSHFCLFVCINIMYV